MRTEIRRIIGYWLQLGVSGFRVDAVPFVIESVSAGGEEGVQRFDYLTELRRFLQWRNGSAILLGEANVEPEENQRYFGEDGGSGIHMMFNFFVNQHLFYALATGEVGPLVEAIRATADIPETSQWAQFLRNHDELDLGRLEEEQRERVFERFAPEERMRLYGRGIRRRLAPMLGDREHEKLAYSAMFALPGSPVIRYGDELRMGDDQELEARDAVRTPMQWADEPNAGFSTAEKLVHPVIDEGVWSYHHINVASQRRDPGSFLNWMARMIRLRKECPEVGWGRPQILDTGSEGCLALRYDWRGNGHPRHPQLRRAAARGAAPGRRRGRGAPLRSPRGGGAARARGRPAPHRPGRARLPLVPDRRSGLRGPATAGVRMPAEAGRRACLRPGDQRPEPAHGASSLPAELPDPASSPVAGCSGGACVPIREWRSPPGGRHITA